MACPISGRLVSRLSTPCYVFDADVFAERVGAVKTAFGRDVRLCYSMKANPFLLSCLPKDIECVEVCSPGELTICERMNVDMKSVIFSGVNKTGQDVHRAVEDKVGVLTAESMKHLSLIENECASKGIVADVLLRIAKDTQFGMDEDCVRQVIRDRSRYPHISIVGVHYFTGTLKHKAKSIIRETEYLSAFVDDIKSSLGYELKRIEYGTGLAVDYFSPDAQSLELERLDEVAPHIRSLASAAELTVEMGRFFAAPCGVYCTDIVDVKCNNGVYYAICSGGMHQIKYDGQFQGMQQPVIRQLSHEDLSPTGSSPWTVCGSLCTSADVLARNVMLSDPQPGDVLVFERVGAYSLMEGMTSFLSRDTAAVYLLSADKGLHLVRPRMFTDAWNMPCTDEQISLI